MNKLTDLIRNDMRPAFGVTEPGAIAFAVSTARSHTKGDIVSVEVALNSGMYKNAFTCGIPNSQNFGNLYAAALGAVAADCNLGLESLKNVTPEDDAVAAKLVDEGKVKVTMSEVTSVISIVATVKTESDTCTVTIKNHHTEIVKIEVNGEVVFAVETESADGEAKEEHKAVIHEYTLHDMYEYACTVPVEDLAFIRDAHTMNLDLLKEGLSSGRATLAGELYRANGEKILSDDALASAQLLCGGAIEARVLGLSRPAMSITGSGSHGIIATMPLYAYFNIKYPGKDDETLLRATALSHLVTMYIKEYSGVLSAFCGCGIASGTGMACGLAFIEGASEKQIEMVLLNMSSGIVGMVCDGGNHRCAMKAIVATDAAFRSANFAMKNICIEGIHGINGLTPEDTMHNMGIIASEGMVQTEDTILKIMENK